MTSIKKKIKIIIIGNIIFSEYLIKYINKLNIVNIVGVITNENKKKSDYSNIKYLCKKLNLNCHLTKNINSIKTIRWAKNLKPDFIFCLGWSQILKKKFLKVSKFFSIGFHPSCLPMNRGKHPLIWSIILDLKFSCTTFFKMDEKIDNGEIISQKKFSIGKKEYVDIIYKKMIKNAQNQIKLIINNLYKKKKINFIKKNKNRSNLWRKRTYVDGKIDWRMDCRSIFNHVRALYLPYPLASFVYKEKNIKIYKIDYKKTLKYNNFEPGKIISKTGNVKIKCADGYIILKKFYPKIKIKGDYL